MLIKKRTKPLPLQKLDALISRLHPNHPNLENIKKDAAIRYKGYIGEQKVDYHLERLTLPCTIAHDIYIKTEQQNFQIDTLILTQRAIYIIEIKKIGRASCRERVYNEETDRSIKKKQADVGHRI